MRIKFNSDDDLPLNKPLKFHSVTIVIGSIFGEDGKLYPQVFLDDTLYWYFKDIGFQYEPYLCNGCHNLIQKAMSFNNVAIVDIIGIAYIQN